MEKGKCIIVCAPSGAGKTTVVRYLIDKIPSLKFSVSATSRNPRNEEQDGVHYHFLSSEAFREKIDKQEFVEWEEVYENQFYGTLKSEIKKIWDNGHSVIFDVDVVGGVNLKKAFGDRAFSVFIKPPSLDVLEERLRGRKSETEESLKKRLQKASYELSFEPKFDWVLINDKLNETCEQALEKVREFLDT
jgi:guanylate kinase